MSTSAAETFRGNRRSIRLPATLRAHWELAFLSTVVVVRLLLSFYRISLPGLQNDEVLFVNAATLRLPGIFLTHSFHGIPTMVFPYTGALKSWLYAPIFSIFGESALSIRLPVELLVTGGLVLLYSGVKQLVNRPVALAVFAVLCFDNTIFWLTRDDVGPNAIEFFFKCAGVWCIARFARDGRARWVALLLVTLALGAFNKLNYIWVIDATVAVSAIVMFTHRRKLRTRKVLVAAWCIGLTVVYICIAVYYLDNHISQLNGPSNPTVVLPFTWPRFLAGMKLVLSGTWFYLYALAPIGARMVVVWATLVLFASGVVASLGPRSTRNLPVACLGLVTLLMAAQTLLTYDATAGWHYMSVYPYVTIVSAYGTWALFDLAFRGRRVLAVTGLTTVAAATVVYDGILMAKYFRQLDSEPSFSAWSPAIYSLSRYVQRTPGTVVVADWGILTPLFALHPENRFEDIEFTLMNSSPTNLQSVAAQVRATPGPKLVITHTTPELVFKTNNRNLDTAIGKRHLRLIRTIYGDAHTPVYLVYRYH